MLAQSVAGIELGDYDRQVLSLVSASQDPVLATIASLIARAGERKLQAQQEQHQARIEDILRVLEGEILLGNADGPTVRSLAEQLRNLSGRVALDC